MTAPARVTGQILSPEATEYQNVEALLMCRIEQTSPSQIYSLRIKVIATKPADCG